MLGQGRKQRGTFFEAFWIGKWPTINEFVAVSQDRETIADSKTFDRVIFWDVLETK
jgi:hypothetical protein